MTHKTRLLVVIAAAYSLLTIAKTCTESLPDAPPPPATSAGAAGSAGAFSGDAGTL